MILLCLVCWQALIVCHLAGSAHVSFGRHCSCVIWQALIVYDLTGNPAARFTAWSDSPSHALIGALSGSRKLNWKIVVAFPSTDYAEFILWSLYLTIAFTAVLFAVLVSMFLTVRKLKNAKEAFEKSEDDAPNSPNSKTRRAVAKFEHSATVAEEEDSLAVKLTPLQAYRHRKVEKIYSVVRFAVVMWAILWIWW